MKEHAARLHKDILVIDDIRAICSLLSDFLRSKGYQLESANRIEEARERLSKVTFAVVITNLHVGKSSNDGIQIVQCVRKLNPSAAVIVISGGALNETLAQPAKSNVCKFMRKPFVLESLYGAVRLAIEPRFQRRNSFLPNIWA